MPDTVADVSPEPAAAIEILLSRAQQLFNSLDPSPFHERDLDQDAEEYIVDSADEYPLKEPLTLIIHLPADQIQAGDTPDLAQALHNYFAYRLDVAQRRLRLYFRDGRISLSAGLVFLFVCIALRQFVVAVGGPADSGQDLRKKPEQLLHDGRSVARIVLQLSSGVLLPGCSGKIRNCPENSPAHAVKGTDRSDRPGFPVSRKDVLSP